MKNRYLILFAALLVIGSMLLVACGDKNDKPADTNAPTAAETEPATNPEESSSTSEESSSAAEESSSTPAEESSSTPAEESSSAPVEESSSTPAEESSSTPAEESSSTPAEESSSAPAEESSSTPEESESESESETEPQGTVIDVSGVTVSSSMPAFTQLYNHATNTTVGAIKDENGDRVIPDDNTLIPLVYRGSVNLGSIDLADYSSITITYAHGHLCVQATDIGSQGIYLTSQDVIGANGALTENHGIIAQSTYIENTDSSVWVAKSTTIDLTNVTYEGNVYLTFEFPTSVEGTNLFFGVTGIVLNK